MVSMKKVLLRLKIIIVLLVVIIASLALYIVYPSIKLEVQGQPFGKRLTGIDTPLTPQELSTINNASNNNYEIAGEMLLNGTIPGEQIQNKTYSASLFEVSLNDPYQTNALIINGKPSVVYIGAISCIYCGENRWAMALALSRFGSFNQLYTGYSSFGDGDVPTLYWIPQNYTAKSMAIYGNMYESSYINFFSAEYDSPITGGFEFPNSEDPIEFFVANATNSTYRTAMSFMDSSHIFQGTPYTFWGTSFNVGADAVVFGNGTSQTAITNTPPLTYITHQQLINQLGNFKNTFAYEEYAAADVYVAEVCPSIRNAAPICSMPAIEAIDNKMGLA
jgi:hypothetical protein